MIVISSTGGSGSSFVAKQFKSRGWTVCLRPDGGKQKATHTPSQIFHQRMDHLIGGNAIYEKSTQEQMFKTAYKGLKENDSPNLMLLCMTWGGLGYLNDIEEKTIFLIRDPIFENYFKSIEEDQKINNVYLINSDTPNAFVLEDSIYFTTELLKFNTTIQS